MISNLKITYKTSISIFATHINKLSGMLECEQNLKNLKIGRTRLSTHIIIIDKILEAYSFKIASISN